MFVTSLSVIPLVSVIHRVFEGTWYVNWRLAAKVAGILSTLLFLFFFVAEMLEYSAEERRNITGKLLFPSVMWLRGVYLGCIVMGFVSMLGTYKEGDDWWVVALPMVFVLLGFFAWPRTIEITGNDIRQLRIPFGYKRIRIVEIESVVWDPSRNEAVVFGKNGKRIIHTMMHIDRDRFLQQIQLLTGRSAYVLGDLGPDLPSK